MDLSSAVPIEFLTTLTRNNGKDYTYRYRKYVLKSDDVDQMTAGRAKVLVGWAYRQRITRHDLNVMFTSAVDIKYGELLEPVSVNENVVEGKPDAEEQDENGSTVP